MHSIAQEDTAAQERQDAADFATLQEYLRSLPPHALRRVQTTPWDRWGRASMLAGGKSCLVGVARGYQENEEGLWWPETEEGWDLQAEAVRAYDQLALQQGVPHVASRLSLEAELELARRGLAAIAVVNADLPPIAGPWQ